MHLQSVKEKNERRIDEQLDKFVGLVAISSRSPYLVASFFLCGV